LFHLLQYKRYGKETSSRILGAVNHVDKVTTRFSAVLGRFSVDLCTFAPERLPLPLQLYRPLNIRVMLVGLEIWSYRDLINVDVKSDTTLDNFLVWRQAELLRKTKHDCAQFVT